MDERERLVRLYTTGRYQVSELAEAFGVSRKTASKWLNRYQREGVAGLRERSRAPGHHPNATAPAVEAAVLRAKAAHPTWGPLKLRPPETEPGAVIAVWPAPSTRGAILARHGLTRQRVSRRHTPAWTQPFLRCQEPNAVWCADFKGWARTQDGMRCDPLTVSDAYSRLLLACTAVARPDHLHVRPVLERLFREHGLPLAMRTDNGPPFASVGVGGLSPLSVWWVKLGIRPERIAPGHPEENGRHERLHRTLKEETMDPPAATLRAQQRRFDAFRQGYNTQRPHQALGQVPPVTRYAASPRPYPRRVEDPVYPDGVESRRVRSNGQLRWRGELVFVSEALVDEVVGVSEEADGWLVSFGPVPLGILRPHRRSLDRLVPATWRVTDVPS